MKQLLAGAGSADSSIISEAVMAMPKKFNVWISLARRRPEVRSSVAVGDHPKQTVHRYEKRQSSCSAAQLNPKIRREAHTKSARG
jgi:hypothetical protein